MKQQNPMLRLWELGEAQHGSLIRAILSAVVGVLCGMAPYFAAAQIILGLLSGNQEFSFYLTWCAVALAGFLLRASLYSLALSISHKATFSILKSIREKILEKLPKMPLGTILDTSSGQMKQVIVDQVESMERPLAHLLPEMTANVLGPVCILVYLFVLDWRMALLSLVSIPVGMAFMMAVMAGYGKQYEGSVRTTQAMNSAIVEYIGGIEVIKAFNQGKQSYARFSDSVKANASYFYHWMKSCQMPISLARAISPTTMITILPAGWLLYAGGSLPVETFITTIVLSLGIAGPLLAAMDFVDSLAKVGTIVGSVDEILNGEEQDHGQRPGAVSWAGHCPLPCVLRLPRGPGGPPRRVPHHPRRHHDRLCRALRLRQVHHRQADRRVLGCVRRRHHPGRAGSESTFPSPSSMTRWPSCPRTTTSLTRASGRTSAWAAPLPPTRRWKPWPKLPGATISSVPWNRAMTPSWEGAAPTCPAGSGSALPSPAPC